MNTNKLQATINTYWENHIIPALFEYIKIPNKSPSFDPEWKANGHMDRVLNLATEWAQAHCAPSVAHLKTRSIRPVSSTHLRAHETREEPVGRPLPEKKSSY